MDFPGEILIKNILESNFLIRETQSSVEVLSKASSASSNKDIEHSFNVGIKNSKKDKETVMLK